MSREIHYWECDVCRRRYDSFEEAEKCEMKGLPVPPPVGIIFGDNRIGEFYHDVVFSTVRPEKYHHSYGHNFDDIKWATRDNGAGDSVGDGFCGGNFFDDPRERPDLYGHVNENMPAFRRMVEFLKSEGITPRVLMVDGSLREV